MKSRFHERVPVYALICKDEGRHSAKQISEHTSETFSILHDQLMLSQSQTMWPHVQKKKKALHLSCALRAESQSHLFTEQSRPTESFALFTCRIFGYPGKNESISRPGTVQRPASIVSVGTLPLALWTGDESTGGRSTVFDAHAIRSTDNWLSVAVGRCFPAVDGLAGDRLEGVGSLASCGQRRGDGLTGGRLRTCGVSAGGWLRRGGALASKRLV